VQDVHDLPDSWREGFDMELGDDGLWGFRDGTLLAMQITKPTRHLFGTGTGSFPSTTPSSRRERLAAEKRRIFLGSKVKKLLILLGAGSSISQGMPSVRCLDALMRQWADHESKLEGAENYYEHLWQATERYYCGSRPELGLAPNFERTLELLLALANWVKPPPHGSPLRSVAADGALPPGLRFTNLLGPDPLPDFGPSVLVNYQLTKLLRRLAVHMREASRNLDKSTDQYGRYKVLFQKLEQHFELGVYTLNYEIVADSVLPTYFNGFSEQKCFKGRRRFEAAKVHGRREWRFLYHLHGSIHHTLNDYDSVNPEVCWQDDLALPFEDGHPGRDTDKRSGNNDFPRTTLIAGGFKLDQLLVEPFLSYYASFVRHMYEADAILIGGYGFADEHVNRALYSRMTATKSWPPVMVLERSSDETEPTMNCEDSWSWHLMSALSVRRKEFFPGDGRLIQKLQSLKAKKGFEISQSAPVAIWHNGFDEASERADAIGRWLSGDQRALHHATLS
jgi:SIR2-like domain